MLIVKAPIVYCDVDDTLVRWEQLCMEPGEDRIEFIDPNDGRSVYLQVIDKTVEALKRHAVRGHRIIVWSAGGAEWAHEVVKKLGIENMVSACLDKPTWYFDDIPASEFLPGTIRRDYSRK